MARSFAVVAILAVVALFASLAASQAAAGFSCPSTYKPADSCTNGPCRCAMFQTVHIQTDPSTHVTEILIRVTNVCKQPVYYAQFSLDSEDGNFALTLANPTVSGGNYQGQGTYQWKISTVDGRAASTKTDPAIKWIRFTPTTSPNTGMQQGSTTNDYEEFRFFVTGYDPVFPWYFQLHQGSDWDTFGPLDMSLCACANCDAGGSVRVIEACDLRYVDKSSNRSPSVFNENEILYSFQIEGNKLELFYSDEHAMTLGIEKVVQGTQTTTFPVTPGTATPLCVSGSELNMGSWNFDGHDPLSNIDGNSGATGCVEDATGAMTCGRPMPPALFFTDITADPASRSGDWQQGGVAYPPQKVCGVWKAATKTISGAKTSNNVYNFDIDAPGNPNKGNKNAAGTGWNLGAGSDPLPIGFINPSNTRPQILAYGTEVMWDLDLLNLNPTHRYRFQFTVHDGDQTRVGGDVGQACIIASAACPRGFTGTTCQQCDLNPLPKDGSYTWYCFPKGGNGNDTYELIKLPTSKLSDPIYTGGFVPRLDTPDPEGFFVSCDCKRIRIPCPNSCCGFGTCNEATGTCTCTNPTLSPDPLTCCPGTNITENCYNDGQYCSGHGTCVSGRCECARGADGTPDFAGAACNLTVTKTKKCGELPVSNCTECLELSRANGLYCGWCTTLAPGTAAALTNGRCSEDVNCPGATGPATAVNMGACLVTTVFIPEPCPDNCTNHGKCTNRTLPLPAGSPPNTTANYTSYCVCDKGYEGANCATPIVTIVTVAAITAGAIVGIVIGVVAFCALAGGGAFAAAQAYGAGSAAPVVNNPIYRGNGNAGTNPLYNA